MLIATCEKYRDKNSEYPQNLSDLVPDFIKEIPVAKLDKMYVQNILKARQLVPDVTYK